MAEGKSTTIRFSADVYRRLERASETTGLPINSIVVVACLEWLRTHGMLRPFFRPLEMAEFEAVRSIHARRSREAYPFDLFSAAARSVLITAQQEAEEQGHRYIGTEHLLLGLLLTPGAAARALPALGVAEAAVREAMGGEKGSAELGPVQRLLPTGRVKLIIEKAVDESKQAGLAQVGSGHLLLGLVQVGDSKAATLLTEMGANEERIRSELAQVGSD
jgi:hypothetical protein